MSLAWHQAWGGVWAGRGANRAETPLGGRRNTCICAWGGVHSVLALHAPWPVGVGPLVQREVGNEAGVASALTRNATTLARSRMAQAALDVGRRAAAVAASAGGMAHALQLEESPPKPQAVKTGFKLKIKLGGKHIGKSAWGAGGFPGSRFGTS